MLQKLHPTLRLVINPELARVPGTEGTLFVRGQAEHVLQLTPDTLTLLSAFRHPRAIGEVLPDASAPELDVLASLIEARALLVEGDVPHRSAVRLVPSNPRFGGCAMWNGDVRGDGALVVLGARFDSNTLPDYPRGTARGPEAIRAATRHLPARCDVITNEMLGYFDVDTQRPLLEGAVIFDAGDLAAQPSATWAEYSARLTDEIRKIRARNATVILLGGDHSITLPAIKALDVPALGVVHIDAHTDLAPVSFPGDVHHGNVFRHIAGLPNVEHIVQLGHRGIQNDAPGVPGIEYTSWSVSRLRASSIAERAELCGRDLPYYLSIDIDGLDPSIAPGTPAPVPEGLLLTETRALIRTLTRGRRILGVDVVEVAPDLDRPPTTCDAAVQLLLEAMACIVEHQHDARPRRAP